MTPNSTIKYLFSAALVVTIVLSFTQCKKKPDVVLPQCTPTDSTSCGTPSAYPLNKPSHFPPVPDFPDNPITVEGVALGKKLFYDPILSSTGFFDCNSCHKQDKNFAGPAGTSVEINGRTIPRDIMPLVNLIYVQNYFGWDGRKITLEEKVKNSIENPNGINGTPSVYLPKLNGDQQYVDMYWDAFCEAPSEENTAKALAQFIRIIFSGNSKFDQMIQGNASLTASEANGLVLYNTDRDINNNIMGADCFHCHGGVSQTGQGNILFSDFLLHNNGLDSTFEKDAGYAFLTGMAIDSGKFRTPSLRNIGGTAPFMHDGRFATLDDVIDFYSEGLDWSSTLDPLMKNIGDKGVQLSVAAKADLKAFILTLDDTTLATNPEYMP